MCWLFEENGVSVVGQVTRVATTRAVALVVGKQTGTLSGEVHFWAYAAMMSLVCLFGA